MPARFPRYARKSTYRASPEPAIFTAMVKPFYLRRVTIGARVLCFNRILHIPLNWRGLTNDIWRVPGLQIMYFLRLSRLMAGCPQWTMAAAGPHCLPGMPLIISKTVIYILNAERKYWILTLRNF